jgi:two-component system response regulator HydG
MAWVSGGEPLLGAGPDAAALRTLIPLIARSDAPVLITGATGTGKEHVARAIHEGGRRAGRPFVAINCAAVPETLLEAEFFGFERGSFTGATAARAGKLSLANGGTLFLDEIAEMPLLGQAKLLRALETREVQPIGAPRSHAVDIRVMAATNQNVEAEVRSGRFRSDLYYRLNVARICVPALADRPSDIAAYVDLFIEEFNIRGRLTVRRPTAELMALMTRYPWPGNVREVRNFVEAVFIDPPDGPIGVEHIPIAFASLNALRQATEGDEKTRMLAALDRTNWNKVEAAKAMNWSRMTLYRKLSKHGLGDRLPTEGEM